MFRWCEWGINISNYYCDKYLKDTVVILFLKNINFFWGGEGVGGRFMVWAEVVSVYFYA